MAGETLNHNVTIEFEGVYRNSKVYINGQLAGGWPYGYTAFYIDADRFLHYGQDNTIKVVAHNQDEPNSRWHSGSGIYRNVNILVGSLLHIDTWPLGTRPS
jgi:beta-galactosidase